jgi:glucose-6-phosphate 1-epimerase
MQIGSAVADLNRRFEISGIARVVEGNGGLAKVIVGTPVATGEMYFHGAHVTSWKPAGAEETLFVSAQSHWENGVAIRGGVPICFPWFGGKADDSKAPSHGFVRAKAWQLDAIKQSGGTVTVRMSTSSDENTKKWWPADFHLEYRVAFGPELHMDLVLKNTGTSAMRFEEALHTYFRVRNIEKAHVRGLDGMRYTDKTDSRKVKLQRGDVVITSETDREYLNTPHSIELDDVAARRRIRITNQNSRTTVVWNPWEQKAKALGDLRDDEWKSMICVETSNVSEFAVELAPGREHAMNSIIAVSKL